MEIRTFWSFLILAMSLGLAHSRTLTEMQAKCYVNSTFFEDGDKFDHWFDGCKFECTCLIRKVKDVWLPAGSCVHQCPTLRYPPYGCEPLSDGCCARSYVCPDGEKCQDRETGMMYAIGQTWPQKNSNKSCECTCFGEGVGKYQCRCMKPTQPKVVDAVEDDRDPVENPCVMDDSQHCAACPIGMITCPIRAKCERWPYALGGVKLECTCYGRRGTRCVSKRTEPHQVEKSSLEDESEGIRAKRATNQKIFEIYFSEDSRQTVEPSITKIQKDARKLEEES